MKNSRPTVYFNAQVFTSSPSPSSAQAFAVQDGKFIAVGTNRYVEETVGQAAEYIDLGRATVTPGFIDCHVHLIDYGIMMQNSSDLAGCRSLEELQVRLRAHLEDFGQQNPDQWILGHGFDQELFDPPVFPTRQDLDKVSVDRPIVIKRICGHAAIGNTRAFELCKGTLKREEGRQTGLVTEDDLVVLLQAAPKPSIAMVDQAIELAGGLAASLGITGVHCLLGDISHLDRLLALEAEGRLPIRFLAQVPYEQMDEAAAMGYYTGCRESQWLEVGAAKIFADGSTGARTSALREDYADDPGNRGLLLIDQPQLTDMIKHAQSHGFQTATHAIGDHAVEVTVNAIEAACAHQPNLMRHRVEHASQMSEKALSKMTRLKIPVAVQPQFILTDFWTRQRVGPERYRWAYPFKTMLEADVPIGMSSDCYVERLDPYELIYRAWVRDEYSQPEALTPRETIRAYTMGSAWAGHQEGWTGSIEEGKVADAVIFREPLFDLSPESILTLRPERVLIGGRPVVG